MDAVISKIRQAWMEPLTAQRNERVRERVREAFPELLKCQHDTYLALGQYLDGTPHRFYSRESCKAYFDIIEKLFAENPERVIKALNESSEDIDRAMLTLNEVSCESWHDTTIAREEYSFMRLCDRTLHPAYLKLAEGVLHRMIVPIATCLRLDRGKSCEDLWKLSSCIGEIQRVGLSSLVTHCDSIVRNSIAHGRITYRQHEVVYSDRNGKSQTFSDCAVIEMVDGLVDVCHGCALALKLFYLRCLGGNIRIPKQIMLEELQAETDTPWWKIEGCLVSELVNESQLVIYARPRSWDSMKVFYMCFYSGVLAEYFVPGFDRYLLSLNSPIAWPGCAIFDGKKLGRIRQCGGPQAIEEYKGVLKTEFILYAPKITLPKLFLKLETFVYSFRLHMPHCLDDARQEMGWIPIVARTAEIHRNGWRAVVNGSVVVGLADGENPQQAVKRARRRIVKTARKYAFKNAKWYNLSKYFPLGYARISVHQKDQRHRQLHGLDSDFICTVQIQFISRIKAPDIFGSTVENVWPYRIAWNKAWLDSGQ